MKRNFRGRTNFQPIFRIHKNGEVELISGCFMYISDPSYIYWFYFALGILTILGLQWHDSKAMEKWLGSAASIYPFSGTLIVSFDASIALVSAGGNLLIIWQTAKLKGMHLGTNFDHEHMIQIRRFWRFYCIYQLDRDCSSELALQYSICLEKKDRVMKMVFGTTAILIFQRDSGIMPVR